MKFGPVAPGDAKGGIVVHSIRQGGVVLKKGTVIGKAEKHSPGWVAALFQAAGVQPMYWVNLCIHATGLCPRFETSTPELKSYRRRPSGVQW